MTLSLHNLKPSALSHHRIKRVGRGNASGHGTFSTRGSKGQRSRAGGRRGLKRLGMKRIIASLPKRRGFLSHRERPVELSVGLLLGAFPAGATVGLNDLVRKGLAPPGSKNVKLIGGGSLKTAITIRGVAATAGARAQIEAAGGKLI